MNCVDCGKSGSGKFCGACGGVMSTLMSGGALTWPFYQDSWVKSLWMPFLWALPLGNFLSTGWALDSVRRRALRSPQLLPQPENAGSILARGFVVFIFWFIYFVIPLSLISWWMSWAWIAPIWELIVEIYQIALHRPHEPISSFLMRNAFVFLSHSGALMFYAVLSAPLFLVARIRYAVTGRATSFFRLFANTGFGLRCFWEILGYFVLAYLLQFAFTLAAVLLFSLPLIGQLLPFALGAAGIWARVFWAGKIGEKLHQEYCRKAAAIATGARSSA